MSAPFDFDSDFAAGWQWARMYRDLGWQVLPAHLPSDGGAWKRPLGDWIEFQQSLVPDAVFARWYDQKTGQHRARLNMGTATGAACGGVFIADLDLYKPGSKAAEWWRGVLALHFNDMEPETPSQRTGGGGRQIFFRAPDGWRPPTFKTTTGIDFRGQGGFTMLPPSRHASGDLYTWEPDRAPWQVEVMEAPPGLIDAIEALRLEHGGQDPHQAGERTASPEGQKNAFGLDVDGREEKMLAMVWAAVVDLYRESPIPPPVMAQEAEIIRLWTQYEQTTKSRLSRPSTGETNAQLLEIEGRGRSEMVRKWRYAMQGWDTKVKAAAAQPRPNPTPPHDNPAWGERLNDSLGDDPGPKSDTEDPPARMKLATPFHGEPPTRHWLALECIPEGVVTSLYSGPGLGKSLLALQLGAATSLGLRWLGIPTKQGVVLMVSCEDDAAELHRRTDDIKLAMGYAIGWPFPDFHIADRVGAENRLAVLDRAGNVGPGPFLAELEAEVDALKPALLILDTLADVYGANEIDRGQVNFFLKSVLGGLIARQKAAGHTLSIALLGHPSDSGKAPGGKGYSGSGAWEAGVRSRLYLVRPDDGPTDERVLTRGKANYATSGDETGIRLTWVEGVFKAERELEDGDPELARIKARALTLIRQAWDAKTPYTQQRGHRMNVFIALVQVLAKEEVEKTTARQAIRELIEDGRVETGKHGGQRGLRVCD